jgi:hypothetical protein
MEKRLNQARVPTKAQFAIIGGARDNSCWKK